MNTISVEKLIADGEKIIPGALVKLRIGSGAGEHVRPGSEVELELKLTVRNQTIVETDPKKPYVKKLEHILPPGLRRAVSTMRRNERALVWMHSSLGFGKSAVLLDQGVKIPKDADLVFEVHLKQWNEASVSTLERKNEIDFERFPSIKKSAEEVDELIRKGRKLEALRTLKNCLVEARKLRIDATENKREAELRENLIFRITVKTATCAYELGKYPQAVSLAREALQINGFDPYVNFICGCAYFSLGHINSALQFVRKAHHADVSNKVYEEKLRKIESHQALIEKDVDYDSDEEDFELFADYCKRKIVMNERKLRKGIERFIVESLEVEGPKTVLIGGGFRPEFLKKLKGKILEKERLLGYDSIAGPIDVLHLHWSS